MAVTRCYIRPEGPRSAHILPDGKSTYQVTYEIETDLRKSNPRSVISAAQQTGPDKLPALGATYFEDSRAICNSIGPCTQDSEEATRWACTVTFGPATIDPQQPDQPPLERPDRHWVEYIEVVKPVETDNSGEPLRNSAGFEFIDPVMMEETYPVLVVQRNVQNLQTIIDQMIEYDGAVNSDDFFGGEKRTVRFLPMQTSQPKFEENITFYEVQYRFAFKSDTWDIKVVDQGFQEINGERIMDNSTPPQPRVEPTPLDGAGNATTAPGAVLEFRVRPEKDLNKVLE